MVLLKVNIKSTVLLKVNFQNTLEKATETLRGVVYKQRTRLSKH